MLVYFDGMFVKIRYLFMIFIGVGIAATLVCDDLERERAFLARLFVALTCAFLILNSVANVRYLKILPVYNQSRIALRHAGEIEGALKRRGISRAYSLYLDSSVGTVISDGRVKILPVLGDMTPLRYMARLADYSHDLASERTAFLRIDQAIAPELAGTPQFNITRPEILEKAVARETLPDPEADIVIHYFDFNPFVFPPGYDPRRDYFAEAQPPG
jgi:hypothetical protein